MELETRKPVLWRGGEWNGGEWKGEIWESGTFRKGTFSGKIWRNGVFRGGTFKGEIWENGIWSGGIWMGLIWIKGYDTYGHLLKIPPSEWPDDASLLCNQARDFESYRVYNERVAQFSEENLFFRQERRKANRLLRIGARLFHPDTEQDKSRKKEKEELFKELTNHLNHGDLAKAEEMIEKAKERV